MLLTLLSFYLKSQFTQIQKTISSFISSGVQPCCFCPHTALQMRFMFVWDARCIEKNYIKKKNLTLHVITFLITFLVELLSLRSHWACNLQPQVEVGELFKAWENNLKLGLRLQIWCGVWKTCLPGREGLMKDAIELHCGKCRLQCFFWAWTILPLLL